MFVLQFTFLKVLIYSFIFMLFLFIPILMHIPRKEKKVVLQKFTNFLILFHLIIIVLILITFIISIYTGERTDAYFIIPPLLVLTFTLFSRVRGNLHYMPFLSLLLISLTNVLIPRLVSVPSTEGIIAETTMAARCFIRSGNLEKSYLFYNYGYYTKWPATALLISLVSEIINVDIPLVTMILNISLIFIVFFAVFSIFKGLRCDKFISLMGILILYSNPNLSFIDFNSGVSAGKLSLAFSLLYILLMLIIMKEKNRNLSYSLMFYIISFFMIVFNPRGPILVSILFTFFLTFLKLSNIEFHYSLYFEKLFLSTLLISLTYLACNSLTLVNLSPYINSFIKALQSTITSGIKHYGSEFYQPLIFQESPLRHAYTWAVSPAISAAYLITHIFPSLRNGNLTDKFVISSCISGELLLLIAFLSEAKYASTGFANYLGGPAYLLLTIPTTIAFGKIIKMCNNRNILAITILILTSYVFLGFQSPNWAPDRSPPSFTNWLSRVDHTTAVKLSSLIKNNSKVYTIRVPLSSESYKRNKNVQIAGSSKLDRYVIKSLSEGKANFSNYKDYSFYSILFIIPKAAITEDITYQTVSLIFSNDYYNIFVILSLGS